MVKVSGLRKRKNIVSLTVLVSLFIGASYYLFRHPDLLTLFNNISFFSLFGLFLLRVALLLVNGLFLKFSAEKFSLHMTFREWFGLSIVTAMGNYLTPFSGGLLFRATYMKRRHGFPLAKFIAILGANYLVIFWAISLVGIIVTSLNWGTTAVKLLFIFFIVVWGLISTLMMLPVIKLPDSHRILYALNVMLEGWELMKSDFVLLGKLVTLALANIILDSLSFWLACQALGFTVSFLAATMVSLVAFFSVVVKVTPANLGIYEAMVSFFAPLVGLAVGEGLVAALLLRGVTIVPVFLLGPCFSYLLTREMISVNLIVTNSLDEG